MLSLLRDRTDVKRESTAVVEKQVLKKLLSDAVVGDTIDLRFGIADSLLSGKYRIESLKTGRGKCGSKLATLRSLSTGGNVSIGTPTSEKILSITDKTGKVFGDTGQFHEDPGTKPNLIKATELKEQLKELVGFGGRQLRLSSSNCPALNGTFTLNSAGLLRGRFGQICLNLTNNITNETLTFWSYKNSGLIDKIEIID